MASVDGNVVVNVNLDSPPLTPTGFTTCLLAGTSMLAGFTERVRTYANANDVAGDSDLGAALSARLNLAFQQTQSPAQIKVGRIDGLAKDEDNVAINNSSAGGETITVGFFGGGPGNEFAYVPAGVETPATISAALKVGIDLLGLPITVTDNGGDIDIQHDEFGIDLQTTAVNDTTPADITLTQTTAEVGTDDELDAVFAVDSDWYCLLLEARTDEEIFQAAEWCETNKRLGVFQTDETTMKSTAYVPSGANIGARIKDAGQRHVVLVWHFDDSEYEDVSEAANRISIDPDIRTTIWAYVVPVGVTVNNITTTEQNNILSYNANLLTDFKSTKVFWPGVSMEGSTGRKIDLVVTADWLKARAEEAIAQLILDVVNAGGKIPYTDVGFRQFSSVVLSVLANGVTAGHFLEGSQQIKMPLLASIPTATREARILNFSFGAEPQGAVEQVNVEAYVSLDLALVTA